MPSEISLPSGTALRKPWTARLQQAYSPPVCRAIPIAFRAVVGASLKRAQAAGRILPLILTM
jgi:hypothetical protein